MLQRFCWRNLLFWSLHNKIHSCKLFFLKVLYFSTNKYSKYFDLENIVLRYKKIEKQDQNICYIYFWKNTNHSILKTHLATMNFLWWFPTSEFHQQNLYKVPRVIDQCKSMMITITYSTRQTNLHIYVHDM